MLPGLLGLPGFMRSGISRSRYRQDTFSPGAFLAWGRAVGEFAAVVMIAYFPMVVSTLIYQRFTTGGLAEEPECCFYYDCYLYYRVRDFPVDNAESRET